MVEPSLGINMAKSIRIIIAVLEMETKTNPGAPLEDEVGEKKQSESPAAPKCRSHFRQISVHKKDKRKINGPMIIDNNPKF